MRAKTHPNAYLRCTEDQNGPAGLDNGVARAGGLLDLVDLLKSPLHGGSEIVIDVLGVLDEASLVTVTAVRDRDQNMT